MNFLESMVIAKNEGESVRRKIWHENHACVSFGNGDLLWQSRDHASQHYHPMHNDIFAEDWEVVL
jgi:hypothetical protein